METRVKMSKKQNKEAQHDYHQYIEGVQTPVLAINKDFEITYINTYGASLVGTAADKIVGKKCYDIFKTTDCKTAKCACAVAMKTKKPATSKTVSNGTMNINYTGSPLLDDKGKVVGAVEYVLDTTDFFKTMSKVEQQVQYLQGVQTPVMAIDRDFNVMVCNQCGIEMPD